MVLISTHIHSWSSVVNLVIAFLVGISVGLVEEVPVELIPDMMIFGLALGFLVQEAFLVQYLHRDKNLVFQERLLGARASTRFRTMALLGPVSLLFIIGMIILYSSDRGMGLSSIARVACVAIIITLGIDPLSGLIGREPIVMVGAVAVYGLVIHAGMSNYPDLAVSLKGYIGTFSAVTCSSMVLTYLLLSYRWTYYRLFCFEQASEWRIFLVDTMIPLTFILSPRFVELNALVLMIYVGA